MQNSPNEVGVFETDLQASTATTLLWQLLVLPHACWHDCTRWPMHFEVQIVPLNYWQTWHFRSVSVSLHPVSFKIDVVQYSSSKWFTLTGKNAFMRLHNTDYMCRDHKYTENSCMTALKFVLAILNLTEIEHILVGFGILHLHSFNICNPFPTWRLSKNNMDYSGTDA